MGFIHLEAEVDNSDVDDIIIYLDDDNNSFIDDTSDISEGVCEHYVFQNTEVNIDNVLKNAYKKAITSLDHVSEFTNFSNPDLAKELPETVTFCSQDKRVSDFEKGLVIPHGVGSIDSFFNAICYAIRYKKTEKVGQCNNFHDETGTELYEKLLKFKLKLNYQRFEEQCLDINKALIEQGYVLMVFEAKNKFITLFKKDSEKQRI